MVDRTMSRGISAFGISIILPFWMLAQTDTDLLRLSLVDLMTMTVTTSTKYEQEQWKSPSTITVISAEDMRSYGYTSAWDALRTVVGSIATDNGNTTTIGFRGISEPAKFNSRILWLIDGHTMNDSYFQRHFPDFRIGVDVDNIKQIEIIRGPASVLYGSNAFSGIVNIVTRTGTSLNGLQFTPRLGGTLTSAGGFPLSKSEPIANVYGGGISYGTAPTPESDILVSTSYVNNRGQVMYIPFFSATRAGAEIDGADFRDGAYGFLRGRYGELSLTAQYMSAHNGMPAAGYGSDPNSKNNKATLRQMFVEGKYAPVLFASVRSMFRAYYDNMNFEATWSYGGDPNLDTQTVPSTTYGAEANAMLQSGQHHILAGLELQKHFTSQTEFYPSEPTYSFNSYSFYNAAVYLQDDYSLSELWSLDIGLRYEFHENVGGILVGKGAIAYHPNLGTVFRFQYGTGFNNPLLHDYFYLSSDLNLRNDAIVKLSRERVSTFGFVWERSDNRIQSSLALYYSVFDRFITITSQDYYDNLSGLQSYGAEYELRYSSAAKLAGYANATLQRTIDSETKLRIPNAPEYSVKAGSVLRPTDAGNISVSLEMQMYGQIDFRDIRTGVHFDQRAHAVVNMHTRYDISESTAISLGIGNLLNTAYRFAPSKGDGHPIYGNGRTYFLRGEVRL